MKGNTMTIKLKCVPTNFYARSCCTICGGVIDKSGVLCEAPDTINGGGTIRACELCLMAGQGEVDNRLRAHAAKLKGVAAEYQKLIGQVKIPSFDEFETAEEHADRECMVAHGLSKPAIAEHLQEWRALRGAHGTALRKFLAPAGRRI